jgi:hypothetical protein
VTKNNNTLASKNEVHPIESHRVVEVFKTNITSEQMANRILKQLTALWPELKVNFDLEDCDKILRVESENGKIEIEKILHLVKEEKNNITILT